MLFSKPLLLICVVALDSGRGYSRLYYEGHQTSLFLIAVHRQAQSAHYAQSPVHPSRALHDFL